MKSLHDATLLFVAFEWELAKVSFAFETREGRVDLFAEGVTDLHIPKKKEWGSRVGVNELRGPSKAEHGLYRIEIEMQTGDVISIVARSFQMP
ncbi:MAG TPA: hypothetical protein VLT91_06995 [Rhizomicrobium sp.]|nr:hypothetical protein [Rhizomicrobium sp.]